MRNKLILTLLLLVPLSLLLAPLSFADDGSGSAVATAPMLDAGGAAATAPAVVPSLPVVRVNPGETVTSAWGLVHQYGWLWGSMIVLFGIGTALVKIGSDRNWLSKDHTLPIVVGLLGTLGAALQAKFAGGSWAGVIATGFAAVMLLIQKPKPSTTAGAA